MFDEDQGEINSQESFSIAYKLTLGAVSTDDGRVSLFLDFGVEQEAPGVLPPPFELISHSFLTVPANIFPDDALRDEWINKSLAGFKRCITITISEELRLALGDAGNYYLDLMGIDPEPTTKKEMVRIHTNETEKRVAGIVGARGQRSKWTRAELERAVTTARRSLKKPNATLDEVAAVLRKTHAKKAPASGEALGVLLRRFKISWKGVKTDS